MEASTRGLATANDKPPNFKSHTVSSTSFTDTQDPSGHVKP